MNTFKFLHGVTFPTVWDFPYKLSWLSENPTVPGILVRNQFFHIELFQIYRMSPERLSHY